MASYEYDSQNEQLNRIAGGTLFADMPIGSEIEYAGTTAPTGFLKCDGSTYSQVTYPELYAILGTTTLPNKSGYIIKAKQIGVPADFASAIEDVIDEKFSYSTSEVNTGKKWIDGKPIYRKVVDCGALPNNTTKSVNLNISNIKNVITILVNSYTDSGSGTMIPYANSNIIGTQISFTYSKTAIEIRTATDYSNYSNTFAILEYTKTTD